MYSTCLLKPANERERLASLLELDILDGASIPELDELTRLACEVCEASNSVLTVFDDSSGYQISVAVGQGVRLDRCDTVCTHILLDNGTLMIADAKTDSVWAENHFVREAPFLRSYVGVPVQAEEGLPIGILCVIHPEPARFGRREADRLERIATLVCRHLETRLTAIRANRAAQKTADERRRQLQYEKIFEALQEGANIYAPDGSVLETNPAAPEILGLSRDQMMGRVLTDPAWRTFRTDGSPFPGDDYPVSHALRGKVTRDVPMGVQLPSGELRWINVNASPVHDETTGAVDYTVVTFADVTAQRLAEEALNQKARKLTSALALAEEASQAKTDFLAVMSHELRTPMNAVLGCAQLLAKSKLDPVQTRTLGVLEDAGKQMLVLLNDLLDLVGLESDKLRLEPEPVNLITLVEDAAVIWAGDIRAKGLTLSVMIDPSLRAPRNVDRARLLQILGNLIANAIKFTEEGSITIQAAPVGRGDQVAIDVIDTGPGVPPEAAARIFSAFEQLDVSTTRRHGGLGIGLHVARRLARAMGGDISLDSREDEGSRFSLRFAAPRAIREAANDTYAAAAAPARDVLCIDDNPRNLYVLSAILRAAGHTVHECLSGPEGLEIAGRRRFDLIVLDMVMPGMDGLEVLTQLKGSGGVNSETPVIACTANVLPDQMTAYRQSGVASVIPKPIDAVQVLTVVASVAA